MTVEKIAYTVFWVSLLLFSCLVGLVLGFNIDVNAQELSMEEAKEVELIKLRASDILYSEPKDIPILDGATEVIGYDEVVDYSYLGNEVDANLAIFQNDNQYTNIEKISDTKLKVYGQPKYYKNDNGQVQEILDERVPIKIWEASTVKTTTEKIQALLKTPYVLADTFYSSVEGYVGFSGSDYSTTHNSAVGDWVGYTEEWQRVQNAFTDGTYYIVRGFFSFDTTLVMTGKKIASSSLFLYATDLLGTSGDTFNLVGSDHSSNSTLSVSDYSIASTTKLSGDVAVSSTGWKEFVLNDVGLPYLNTSGYTKLAVRAKSDVDNQTPTSNLAVNFATSESTNDPYLVITLAENEEEPENPTASSTADLYPCSIPENSRIDIITGCKNIYNGTTSSSTITAVEYYYYQIPFAIWVVLGTMFIYLFVRLRFEYIIRFRK